MRAAGLLALFAAAALHAQVWNGLDRSAERVVEGVALPEALAIPGLDTSTSPIRFTLTDPVSGRRAGPYPYRPGTALGSWRLVEADEEGFALGLPFAPAEARLPRQNGILIPAVSNRPARRFEIETPTLTLTLPPRTRVLLLPANQPTIPAELDALRQALARTAAIRNDNLATTYRTDLPPITVRTPSGVFARPLVVKPSPKQTESARQNADYFAHRRLDDFFARHAANCSRATGATLNLRPAPGQWLLFAQSPDAPKRYWLGVLTVPPLHHLRLTLDAANARPWDNLFF
ncbi:MAG: hypothetical protein ACI4X9_04915 [Kiritimatiellia bacterium]